jgi:excisionase family DNA binding protein
MQSSDRLTLTAREASQLLGLSRTSVYQGISTGEIPHVKVGKRILIPKVALEKLLSEASVKKEG